MFMNRDYVVAGGLISMRRASRRCTGAPPRTWTRFSRTEPEISRQQPTSSVVINMKAAKALGLALSPSILGRADDLIQ
jgi:hypothetical protein